MTPSPTPQPANPPQQDVCSVHWMLLLLVSAFASVPLVSEDRALLRELRLASEFSLRGGIRSLMRSKPLASAKLVILCWGEKPFMAEGGERGMVGMGGGI